MATCSLSPDQSIREESHIEPLVSAVRRFNRFYTRQIGVLQEGLLRSPFSLTEVRVLYEIAHRSRPSAAELSRELGVDAGYLSRILRDFVKRGLVRKLLSETDARQAHLELTKLGRQTFGKLDARSSDDVAAMLEGLPPVRQKVLIEAMSKIEKLLNSEAVAENNGAPYLLRTHQPGDMGWVVFRHGVLYAEEYGYDERFEALVAGIVAEFIKRFDAKRERCWIAERDGEIIGCVFLVKKSKTVAKLRLLLVEPCARGIGLGKRLVAECVRFARQVGYHKIVLWTQSELAAARRIYEWAGFRLSRKQSHHSWGRDLVAETWELKL
jgi:DNA-binding MarR family transcriptional regulator/N-acetylglutamate synthase-like GNAT family acetyltransferase